jgi:hypothetical protein
LLPANIEGDRGLRGVLENAANRRVEVFAEFLDVPRFGGESYVRAVTTFLRDKYASLPPDVIVVGGDSALKLLLGSRAQLFPHAPVVHMGVDASFLRALPPLPANVVGIPVEYDAARTIELALRLHPDRARLVLVTGASEWGKRWETRLRGEALRFQGRAQPEFLAGLPTDTVRNRLAALGADAVVFTPGYFEDGEGRILTPRESARLMAAAPVYGPFNTFLGTGIVSGFMPSFEEMGNRAGQIVNDLLDGAAPASLRLPEAMPVAMNLDWRQVRRWGIDEKLIPNDAVVHFKEPTFWEDHRNEVGIAAAVFLLQAALIGWLLAERRRRRWAEHAEQNHRSDLAHASRLAVAGELTGAIAHEINQPLGAILSNADAADLLLASDTDRRDEVRQILADIRRDDLRASEVIRRLRALLGKHEVERQPFSLEEAVSDIGPLLHAEARRRWSVTGSSSSRCSSIWCSMRSTRWPICPSSGARSLCPSMESPAVLPSRCAIAVLESRPSTCRSSSIRSSARSARAWGWVCRLRAPSSRPTVDASGSRTAPAKGRYFGSNGRWRVRRAFLRRRFRYEHQIADPRGR